MVAQVYTLKITYADCNEKIWRKVAVSSNYTLVDLGYMILATFDTMAYHLFEMEYKGVVFTLGDDDDFDFDEDENSRLLFDFKIGQLGMSIGDTIEMIYDFGCDQQFDIQLIEVGEMPKGSGRGYPKILDGAGRGIVDDMPAFELLEIIKKVDKIGHSEVYYSCYGSDEDTPEWNYRNYDIDLDNYTLKRKIKSIKEGFEEY